MLWRQRRRERGLGMKAEAWGKRCDALARMKGLGCREDHALGDGNCLETQGLRSWMVHVLRMSMRWRGGKGGRDDDAEHRCVCLWNVRREDFERWPEDGCSWSGRGAEASTSASADWSGGGTT